MLVHTIFCIQGLFDQFFIMHHIIAVGDRMFLGMQDFDFAQILDNYPKFGEIY